LGVLDNVRAVLFDLDGTLVHTRIDFPGMKRRILEEVARVGLDPERYRTLDILAIVSAVSELLPDPSDFQRRTEDALISIELDACDDAEEAEGAADTLRWLLDCGVRVGIVTRNSPQAVARVLESFHLPHEVLLTRADTPRVKPDPVHLELALFQLGVDPAHSVMVGDHLMDILGGKAAGTRTVGILTPDRPPGFFQEAAPDLVIHALPELRTWISPS
jgi:HAD superfamily hydrolase (TIGR01549 family)